MVMMLGLQYLDGEILSIDKNLNEKKGTKRITDEMGTLQYKAMATRPGRSSFLPSLWCGAPKATYWWW